jgi:hypothetical protein
MTVFSWDAERYGEDLMIPRGSCFVMATSARSLRNSAVYKLKVNKTYFVFRYMNIVH